MESSFSSLFSGCCDAFPGWAGLYKALNSASTAIPAIETVESSTSWKNEKPLSTSSETVALRYTKHHVANIYFLFLYPTVLFLAQVNKSHPFRSPVDSASQHNSSKVWCSNISQHSFKTYIGCPNGGQTAVRAILLQIYYKIEHLWWREFVKKHSIYICLSKIILSLAQKKLKY